MAGMQNAVDVGFEIPQEQRTPLVESLLRVIQDLKLAHQELLRVQQDQQRKIDSLTQEINRFKGLPEKRFFAKGWGGAS